MTIVEILVTPGCPQEGGAVSRVVLAAQLLGDSPEVHLIEIATPEDAHFHQFAGSPTIRVNGRDIAPPIGGQASAITCRRYRTSHGLDVLPDLRTILDALVTAVTFRGDAEALRWRAVPATAQ